MRSKSKRQREIERDIFLVCSQIAKNCMNTSPYNDHPRAKTALLNVSRLLESLAWCCHTGLVSNGLFLDDYINKRLKEVRQ